MSAPTDKTLRAAVIAWTKAELRRTEYALSNNYFHDSFERSEHDKACRCASDDLCKIGGRLLAENSAKRGKR